MRVIFALLTSLLEWLAAEASANLAVKAGTGSVSEAGTADRAGQLIAAPREAFEPEVSRAFGLWALWAAVGVVLVILVAGYARRRWKEKGEPRPAWFTRRNPR